MLILDIPLLFYVLEIKLGLGKMYQAKKQNTYSTFQHFMKDNIIMIKK